MIHVEWAGDPPTQQPLGLKEGQVAINLDQPIRQAATEFERFYLLYWLKKTDWNVAAAAREAGIGRTGYYRSMRRLHIPLTRTPKK